MQTSRVFADDRAATWSWVDRAVPDDAEVTDVFVESGRCQPVNIGAVPLDGVLQRAASPPCSASACRRTSRPTGEACASAPTASCARLDGKQITAQYAVLPPGVAVEGHVIAQGTLANLAPLEGRRNPSLPARELERSCRRERLPRRNDMMRWLDGWRGVALLFAVALVVYWIEALAWPLQRGRDSWDYWLYYLQLADRHPVFWAVQLFRTPLTPLVTGIPMTHRRCAAAGGRHGRDLCGGDRRLGLGGTAVRPRRRDRDSARRARRCCRTRRCSTRSRATSSSARCSPRGPGSSSGRSGHARPGACSPGSVC